MSKLYDTLNTGPRRKANRGSSDGMPDLFEFFAARKAAEEARAIQRPLESEPVAVEKPAPVESLAPVDPTPAEEDVPVGTVVAEPAAESLPSPPSESEPTGPETPLVEPEPQPEEKTASDLGVDPRRATARSVYSPGTRVAQPIKPQPPSIRSKIILLAGTLVAGALVFGAYTGVKKVRQSIRETESMEPPVSTVEPLPPEGMEEPDLLSQTSTPPDIFIQGPGTVVRREGNTFVIIFEQGLFSHADQLSREAERLLKELGKQLADLKNIERITVTGCTDNAPIKPSSQFKDNRVLGMQRALAVVKILRAESSLPNDMFQVLSPGVKAAPYPNDTAANRAKNRTATIQVTLSGP